MRRWPQSAAIGVALLAAICVAKAANDSPSNRSNSPAATAPTYTRDIAPILFRSCAPCHRPGEAAPFSLLTYSDAKRHASQIADVTKRHFMPPWLPQEGYGEFQDERRLSDAEKREPKGCGNRL